MSRMKRRRRRLLVLAEETVPYVMSESTRKAIEKMAEEFAREMLADPEVRAEIRQAVGPTAEKAKRALRR